MKNVILMTTALSALAILGCEKKQETPKDSPKPAASNPPIAAKPSASPSSESGAGSGHSGENIELGIAKIGPFSVRASRDKGELKPGGDSPVDVWLDEGLGKGVAAVRFWIGSQDAKGSIKAKAAVEEGKWHSHVELPAPMTADAKLWVEIEDEKGGKSLGSFELKGH